MHTLPSLIIGVYSLLVLVGGYFGYKKKKSVPSLVAGIVSAVLLDIASAALFFGHSWGLYMACVIALGLLGFFAGRFVRSPDHPFMPAGLMTILSILTLIGLFLLR